MTHEQIRLNIDAGHIDQWPMYIDSCLDAGVPVLMDSFECAAGRGADVLLADGRIGIWKQYPYRIGGKIFFWTCDRFKISESYVFREIINMPMGFADADEGLAYLLFRMNEFAKLQVEEEK